MGSRSEPGDFGSSESEPLEKKKSGAGAGVAWKKSQEAEPEPLKKISRLLSPAKKAYGNCILVTLL